MRGCSRPDIPCHRVIAAGGQIGKYGGRESLKRALLAAEGVVVSRARVIDFERIRWKTRTAARRSPSFGS
jgi:methylated-DNA-[protein]-cysteine S-methyltransferase